MKLKTLASGLLLSAATFTLGGPGVFAGTSLPDLLMSGHQQLRAEDQQDAIDIKFCGKGGGFYDPASGVCFRTRGGSNPP